MHQLSHGHIERAFQYNPLLVVSLPYILLGLVLDYTPLRHTHPVFYQRFYGKTASLLVFGIVILFWIGRNLP
ncbi:hypothetical protein GCM10027299_54740 [Larkinella ripae]